ncbi:CHC2 zinc finger domain-containing protein [Dyella humi]|uniref:Toprim domain-containing protein n=1 Tax=Dyella humi TaxID=1770547 RepID=A0ABW8ICW0_9GAMM
MARISERELERLKDEVSIRYLVEARGVALTKQGADWIGRCPFHDDKTPSLVVSPSKNLWHCLGACQTGGSVIDWVMKSDGVSFRHAVERLREGVFSLSTGDRVQRSTITKLPAPVAYDADDKALLRQVIDYYHDTLKQSPEALAYLQSRGLNHPELVERFRLGFANRTLGLRLPEKNRKAGGEIRARLQTLGLLRDSGHEHFNGSLVVPVLDEHGEVTEIYGRKITDNLRAGTPLHLYLPGPHRGLWNLEAVQASTEIILCEALIDAMTFWCAGYRNVTAAYGVEGFTADHLAAFLHHGTERVLIAYDRDAAGEAAAEKLAKQLMGVGIACYRIHFPKGMDANAYALHVQPATKALGLVIRKAVWLGEGQAPARPDIEATVIAHEPLKVSDESPLAAAVIDDVPAIALTPEPALPASPLPPALPSIASEVSEHEIILTLGERRYRVRGLARNLSPDSLKINLLVSRHEQFYVDTLDLYAARARTSYATQAAVALGLAEGVMQADLGRVLLHLETVQDDVIKKKLEPAVPAAVTINPEDREAALALLQSPTLLDDILADFDACGVVGERTNKLIGYLAAVSRKLTSPLAVVVQSASAAGKSSLMDAVLAFMPEEERIRYSAMTGQSLYYLGQNQLKHKILAIAEEEGVRRAAYALKLLQSEGELMIASTGKDPATGNLVTQEYRVEGPVMIFLTTTAIEIDEELLNRCLVLSVDEGREQTQAIHRRQRAKRTLEGLKAREERDYLCARQQNAQRLLRPLAVVNPYADQLTFMDDRTRTRRDHEKYLTLIDTIALLHQYQRPIQSTMHRGKAIEYIEVTWADIAQANALAHDMLGRSLDELPPQTRNLLRALCTMVDAHMQREAIPRNEVRFSRREVREATAWGDTQLRVHLDRLVAMEYLLVHRGSRGQSFVYELLYDGDGSAAPYLSGLIDVTTMGTSRGAEPENAGPSRVACGVNAAPVRSTETPANADTPTAAINPVLSPRNTHVLGTPVIASSPSRVA